MTVKNRITVVLFSMLFLGFIETGCKKYLEAKPNKALAVPDHLIDLQALMDWTPKINLIDPTSGVQSVDDFYLTQSDYDALSKNAYRELYTWGSNHLFDSYPNDWSFLYDKINLSNIVLDNLNKIKRTSDNLREWNNIKGQGLLLRSRSFLQVAWLWTKPYDKNNSKTDLGIPLRLQSDFNMPSIRASLEETYGRILTDLKESVYLLPETPVHEYRASRPAAYALLAQTYLSMRDYINAGKYADSCLQLFSNLIDFNSLNASAKYPVPQFNEEVIISYRIPVPTMFTGTRAKIDSLLYQSYSDDDLRKTIFFANNNGFFNFKGSYEGTSAMFGGIATDEVILMKAECLARAGNTVDAMAMLNSLLITRWKTGSFVPFTASDANNSLQIILDERRKELLMRGLRWMDIKRLNKEERGIVMNRYINGQTYTLAPNDPRYVFPIPDDIIALTGMQQNSY